MLFAKVVFGLAIEDPFDYYVPLSLQKKIKVGCRVWVSLRNQRKLGYVVKLTAKTDIRHLKPILAIIDDLPVLDKIILLLTKMVSDYYCCSWGEAIDTALPEGIRKGKILSDYIEDKESISKCISEGSKTEKKINNQSNKRNLSDWLLIQDPDNQARWEIYISEIKKVLENNKSAIVLLPDIDSVFKAKEIIKNRLNFSIGILYRKQPGELEEWARLRQGDVSIIIGTRSSIFAPVKNLGLIIIDNEENSAYKQDRVPHYHAREVAFMRTEIEAVKLILGSSAPSLESFYLVNKSKIKFMLIPRQKAYPEVKIIDTKDLSVAGGKRTFFLPYLIDSVSFNLANKVKTIFFLNRRGFATLAFCRHCGTALKCSRCNINLVYHFRAKILNCHYCNFKMQPPDICPNCNSGYIRYLGVGTEKIESELTRVFPQAKIKRLDKYNEINIGDADIFIATKSIMKLANLSFGLVAILAIDNSLNRVDFRSSEKTFNLLVNLLRLTEKKMIIQTGLSKHHCFQALKKNDFHLFYNEELKQRKSLRFSPYQHLCLVKLRGEKEIRVKELSNKLFKILNQRNKNKNIKIISVNPSWPAKLRGNFYWQILIKAANPYQVTRFLKNNLKDFSHSGIIVTVDVDPI